MPRIGLVQKNSLPWRIPGKGSVLLPLHVCGQRHASEPLGPSSAPHFHRALGYPPPLPAWDVARAFAWASLSMGEPEGLHHWNRVAWSLEDLIMSKRQDGLCVRLQNELSRVLLQHLPPRLPLSANSLFRASPPQGSFPGWVGVCTPHLHPLLFLVFVDMGHGFCFWARVGPWVCFIWPVWDFLKL